MRKRNFNRGYSKTVAEENLDLEKPVISIGSRVIPQYKWESGKRTDEIVGYQCWFVQANSDPFKVKFLTKPTLPAFLAEVTFEDLEGCEVGNNIFLRAKGVH